MTPILGPFTLKKQSCVCPNLHCITCLYFKKKKSIPTHFFPSRHNLLLQLSLSKYRHLKREKNSDALMEKAKTKQQKKRGTHSTSALLASQRIQSCAGWAIRTSPEKRTPYHYLKCVFGLPRG
ncbi:hypothetical protein AVEN_168668-1 [Araneus ventricosus]|uniref:Uncharacterized protein n=1 Tax=Araneus ventricosus TaxID=182803 RepID=A0A4Y2M2A5_ARAVE|nr:hypothetical protein AVEN_168668-1 [Araneus ventricosus]